MSCLMITLFITQLLFGAFLPPDQMHNGKEGPSRAPFQA